MRSSDSTVIKNTFFLYIMTGAKFVLPLIITAWLTRRLGPDSYGIISYLTPVMGYFILLFDFGFDYCATKKISQNRNDHKYIEKTIAAVYTAKILLIPVGLIFLFILFFFVPLLRNYIFLTLIYYFSTAAQIFIPDFLYRGLEKMEGITKRYILAKFVTAILIVLIVRDDRQLILVPLAYLVGNIIAAFYTNFHMVQKMGYHFSLASVKDAVSELKESSIYFLSTFASTALSVTSTFVMGIVGMPVVQIAYWGVAFQVVQAVQSMYDPITTSIYPHVAEKKNYKFVLKVTAGLLPLVAVGCVILYGLAGVAVNIIAGDEYMAAVPVLQHLIPVLLFSFVAQMIGFPLLGALGQQSQISLTTLVAAGVQIVGLIILAACDQFTLVSLCILRIITEFILMSLRIYYVCVFLRQVKTPDTAGEEYLKYRGQGEKNMGHKIGQITLYNFNYGSALQCFATQQVVRELTYYCVLFRQRIRNKKLHRLLYFISASVQMVLHPTYAREFMRMMLAKRKTALSALRENDFQGIQKFIEEDICSMEVTYRQMKRKAHTREYTAFLSGSDQVWNGSWFLRNDAYFLKFAPQEKRIAWAPSFGMDHVASYNRQRFAKDIAEYSCLSVREKSGVNIIKQLTGRNAVQIIDPVLLLTAGQWRELYQDKTSVKDVPEPYVFFYFLNEPSSYVLDYLDMCIANGYTIVAFASNYDCLKNRKQIVFKGGSPWNYLKLVDGATEVCSDSYHALAFSLLFHKKMCIFHRNYLHSSDQSERITSIMCKLGIQNRFIQKELIPEELKEPIPFEKIDGILCEERLYAKEFLRKALEGCE